jgi:predicted ATPase
MFLRSLSFDTDALAHSNVPLEAFKNIHKPLDLSSPITFLTGDNGVGKSTILETLALHLGLNLEGGSGHVDFVTKNTHLDLSECSSIIRESSRPRQSFFLRSETFYNLATYLEGVEAHSKVSFHTYSHGMGFMEALRYYLHPKGLYLLDEPESPLSIKAQIELLILLKTVVDAGSQLIIATHSPVILSFPGATIYQLSAVGIDRKEYEDTDAYMEMKFFMDNRESYVRRLLV